jgi:hypothetical protein
MRDSIPGRPQAGGLQNSRPCMEKESYQASKSTGDLGPRWPATGVIKASVTLTSSKTSSAYPKVTCLEADAQGHDGVELGEYQ